jgi:histidinol-phosphate aminotransferase
MTAAAIDLARDSYRRITLYAPEREPCAIDLSDNTNLWGVPPSAAAAIRDPGSDAITRYPPIYADDLKRALAAYIGSGATAASIVTGCGSDDVLDSAIRAFAEPGDAIAYPDPSFGMIPIFARMNGLQPVAIPLTAEHDIDAEALLATRAKIIYICSPNNPTGVAASRDAVAHILRNTSGIVLIDEAYAEFARDSNIELAMSSGRAMVVRTMSKAFGLAGLRVGYAAGPPELIAEVEKSRGPYKVSALAARAALAAVERDIAWVKERVALAIRQRELLTVGLRKMGLAPLPSAANFVLVPVADAVAIAKAMRAAGVAVRPFVNLPVIGDALRVTVAPPAMTEACLTALERAVSC